MNQIDRNKIRKMIVIILLLFAAVGIASYFHKKNSMTLDEYARLHSQNGSPSNNASGSPSGTGVSNGDPSDDITGASMGDVSAGLTGDASDGDSTAAFGSLTGALLNGGPDGKEMLSERITYKTANGTDAEGFYHEPLSENLRRYITGISYPVTTEQEPAITYDELRYVHVLHYDFEGSPTEGELICNAAIADDLLDIFYELYRNEYQIEKMKLIDEYNGDDTASMEDNNTSCFNYRVVEGSTSLSRHAYGLALDINPFYNPYITYTPDGTQNVSPAAAQPYADRNGSFPYKIDEDDLCYKLFIQHGFTWGGNWNSSKDYQHFQKTLQP